MSGRENRKSLWVVLGLLVAAALIGAETIVHRHSHFRIEETYGFFPLLSAGAVVVFVFVSKLIRAVFGREEESYD